MVKVGGAATGLTAAEAAARLTRFGPNALPVAAGDGLRERLLRQFANPLIYTLLASALITAWLGHAVETVVILGVVLINGAIGYVQEGRAEKALQAIRNMISPRASVLRDGRRVSIVAADVVPGDALLLEPGDRVSADVRLVKARNLCVDESPLTGESVAVEKSVDAVRSEASLGDRRSMVHAGTQVTVGQGTGIVVATGAATELGRISTLLGRVEEVETPLLRQMNRFARRVTAAILGLSAATVVFAVALRDYSFADALMAAVGMAVAAIPEGLPAVMTITLAIGVQRMAARHAIIRRLPAVETLGSVSIICSDKTGTLTRNEMTAARVIVGGRTYCVSGSGYAPKGGVSLDGREIDPDSDADLMRLTRTAILCNDSSLRQAGDDWTAEGDPMEGALVVLGLKTGHDVDALRKQLPRLDEIPFDAATRFMATLHHTHDGSAFVCVKGAPECVLGMCAAELRGGDQQALDRLYWASAIDQLAGSGYRVLAFASKEVAAGSRELGFADVGDGLVLEGVVGLIDPPREEAAAAVVECKEAGIAVKMITGDHLVTATAIAGQLGFDTRAGGVSGQTLDGLDGAELRRMVAEANVFARTSPENKLRLVEALQAGGAVVAMTGDGVNDAPALKRADVGVAMGRHGTEAAKEAAEMVLADDNFASIVSAVREGRAVYDNLTKVIAWTLPTSGGETLIIMAAILLGVILPVTPLQVLWLNMVSAVALGLVLAFEPAEPEIMRRPPRAQDEGLLSPFLLWRIVLVSIVFAIGAFAIFAWARQSGSPLDEARTMVVNAIVAMEIAYLFNVRYLRSASLTWEGLLGTRPVIVGVGTITVLQGAFTYMPWMQRLFETRGLSPVQIAVVAAVGVLVFAVLELEKHALTYVSNGRAARRLVVSPGV
jgi:potassium/sodium efflux P-type ATPase